MMISWALLDGSAFAQSQDEALRQCNSGHSEAWMSACTTLLEGPGFISGARERGAPGHPDTLLQAQVELPPNVRSMAYYHRGLAYVRQDNLEAAVQDFTQSIQYGPVTPYVFYERGRAYALQGKYDLAIKDYKQILKVRPNDTVTLDHLGRAKRAEGEIVRQNIARFEKQLETERDEGRRKELTRLLDLERKKLKALDSGS